VWLTARCQLVGLETYEAFKDHLVKVIVPRSAVARMRAELATIEITETIIFPELDGLCRELLDDFAPLDPQEADRPSAAAGSVRPAESRRSLQPRRRNRPKQ
jgi:hypothetical protein